MDDSTDTERNGPSHLDLLFEAGPVKLVDTVDNIVHRVERRELGTLSFDELWIGDPFSSDLERVSLPPDLPRQAQVRSLIDRHGEYEHAAALGLIFRDSPPERWKLAEAGVATDCAIGGLSARDVANLDGDQLHALLEQYQSQDHHPMGCVLNDWLVLSNSGYADGYYDAWWGLDAAGRTCCLIVDYALLDQPTVATKRLPIPLKRGTHRFDTLPGVTLKVGLRRSRPKLNYRLDAHFAYARIVTPEGEYVNPNHRFALVGNRTTLDLSQAPDGSELEIRLVTGYEPLNRDRS